MCGLVVRMLFARQGCVLYCAGLEAPAANEAGVHAGGQSYSVTLSPAFAQEQCVLSEGSSDPG